MNTKIRLPRIFSSGCVLQRGSETSIYGWASPFQEVEAVLCQEDRRIAAASCRADDGGRFCGVFSAVPAGGPYILEVYGKNVEAGISQKRTVKPVYAGDVFVCAGQSNMELPLSWIHEAYVNEFKDGGVPEVHIYKVEEKVALDGPVDDHETAVWTACTAEKMDDLSALSYFIGKELWERYQIPVGIVNLSLGGTPVEAWMSEEALEGWPFYLKQRDEARDDTVWSELSRIKSEEEELWQRHLKEQEAVFAEGTEPWKDIQIPGSLEEQGIRDFCGSIRLKKVFHASEELAGKPALLRLGLLIDSDETYLNGQLVGTTDFCYPPRRYAVPQGLLKEGENEIEIRLISRRKKGGAVGGGKPYDLLPGNVDTGCWPVHLEDEQYENALENAVPLSKEWQYQIRASCGPAPQQIFRNRKPTGLFNGMLFPCFSYRVQGVIWYQGESNDGYPDNYEELLTAMIRDWRVHWKREDLPFVIVQLPNCGMDSPENDAWPLIREAQRRTADKMKRTVIVVTLDVGDDMDLHPWNKSAVGHRVFLALRHLVYQEKNPWRGPVVQKVVFQDGMIHILMDTGDEGPLCITGAADNDDAVGSGKEETVPEGLFEIAGEDGVFFPVKAQIREKKIVLLPKDMIRPVTVRYAWSRTPGEILLKNQSGLCASPFLEKVEEEENEE